MKKIYLLLTGTISATLPLLSVSCIDNVQINQEDDNSQVEHYRQEGETLYIESKIINRDIIEKITKDKSINPEAVTKIYSKRAKLVSFQTSTDNISKDSNDILKFKFKNLKEIDLINVERIDYYAFTGIDSLISVNLSNVIEIGDEAFYKASSLKTFNAPKLKKLGREVFYGTELIKDIKDSLIIGKVLVKISPDLDKISNTEVEYVADFVFGYNALGYSIENTQLKSIDLPNVTEIDQRAFLNAKGLKIINLPRVIKIKNNAFKGASELTKVNLPNVMEIESYAFEGASKLTMVDLPNVIEIKDGAFYKAYSLKTFNAPKLKNVYFSSFSETPLLNEKLEQNENLIIGKVLVAVSSNTRELFNTEIEYVANSAIGNNKVLISVNLPNVIEIGDRAFTNASSLKTFNAPKLKKLGWEVFYGTELIKNIKDLLIIGKVLVRISPDLDKIFNTEVEYVGPNANKNNYILTSIDLPNVIEIGPEAFEYASNLEMINLPNVTKIGSGAFKQDSGFNKPKITSIDLPNVTEIGEKAFINFYPLETINAPKLKNIGKDAFKDTKVNLNSSKNN